MSTTMRAAPRTLASFEYTTQGTSTTTLTGGTPTGHGGPLSNAWGGDFTIADRKNVEIELNVPYVWMSHGSTTDYLMIHLIVDGACKAEDIRQSNNTSYPGISGGRSTIRILMTNLDAGNHTVAVQLAVSAGTPSRTGTVDGASTNKGLLTVREVD